MIMIRKNTVLNDLKDDLEVLFSVYAYTQAQKILANKAKFLPTDFITLLDLVSQRTKLVIDDLFDPQKQAYFRERYGFDLVANPYDEELLTNYIMVLESQLRIGDTIDFVRAVSPIIYRLFLRLAVQQEPTLPTYIHNAKDDRYDTWYLNDMSQSSSQVLRDFSGQTGDARVTSKSLQDLLLLCDLPETMKGTIRDLRRFEKSVRNPLAHLIKPFDEAELHRTTGFSSQDFLTKIIQLARYTGLVYEQEPFYFDRVNQLLLAMLQEKP